MAERSIKNGNAFVAISGKKLKVKGVLDAAIKNTNLGNYVSQVLIPEKTDHPQWKACVKERNPYSGYVFIEATYRRSDS